MNTINQEEINDAKAMYGLNPGWYYKNILVTYYYRKDFKYESDTVDGNIRIYEDKKYYRFIEFRKFHNKYKIYISLVDQSDMFSGYRYDCSVSEKLGNSFIRYFTGKASKLDVARLKDYVKRKAFYGTMLDKCFG